MSNRPEPGRPTQSDEFQPGQSFAEQPAQSVDGPEALPSWLQNFADTVSTDESAPRAGTGPLKEADMNPQPQPEARPEPAATAASSSARPETDEGVGFLSDDDLPEWLRSLDPNASATASATAHDPFSQPVAASSIEIPTVARVWVTPHEDALAPASAPLFASIVSVIDDRPDVLVSEVPSDVPTAPTVPVERPTFVHATPGRAIDPNNGRWSTQFKIMVAAFILLTLFMVWVLMRLQ